MLKKLFISMVLFSICAPDFAQVDTVWVRRYSSVGYNADQAYAIAVDGYGNVYVTGSSRKSGIGYNYTTIKYYPNGDTAWVRKYNGPGNDDDFALALAIDASGNVYVTGRSFGGSGTGYDIATIKYHTNGDTAWVRRYNRPENCTDNANAIVVDGSGNVYVSGYSEQERNNYDYITLKYYPNGDSAWARTYNGPGDSMDMAYAIAVDCSNNVYVTGGIYGDSQTKFDYATIKYYPNGDTAWVRRYVGIGDLDVGHAIVVDSYGSVYVAGSTGTIKYDTEGNQLWIGMWGGRDITVDGSGNTYVSGIGDTSGADIDYLTIKYCSNGDTAWVRRYNGPANGKDEPWAIAIDGVGNVYVTGYSAERPTYPENFDYATVKYYPNGDTAWTVRYNGPSYSDDLAFDIALDGLGNVYVTGQSDGIGTFLDYATIKYVQFLCGDANKDGIVDVGDVVYLINYLFKEGPSPVPILKAGDASCDGVVDIGDVVYLINYLFKDGPEPCC